MNKVSLREKHTSVPMPSSRAQLWLGDSALEEKQAIGQVIPNLIPKDRPCLQQSMEKFKPKGLSNQQRVW